jgi:RNA polymerase sigma-70 factor (ECF subfamily)
MSKQFINDATLVANYIKGDESSLEKLLVRHQSEVFRYIYRVVKNRTLADDIFQDTFFTVIKHLKSGTYQEQGKFLAWVMTIAHNVTIDFFRESKKVVFAEPKQDNTTDNEDVFEVLGISEQFELKHLSENSIELELIKKRKKKDLRKMINVLPPKLRETILLQHYFKMSFKEISKFRDININTACTRSYNAVLKLREMMNERGIDISNYYDKN